jgi:hypothetical protein
VGSQRLTAWAMARPIQKDTGKYVLLILFSIKLVSRKNVFYHIERDNYRVTYFAVSYEQNCLLSLFFSIRLKESKPEVLYLR